MAGRTGLLLLLFLFFVAAQGWAGRASVVQILERRRGRREEREGREGREGREREEREQRTVERKVERRVERKVEGALGACGGDYSVQVLRSKYCVLLSSPHFRVKSTLSRQVHTFASHIVDKSPLVSSFLLPFPPPLSSSPFLLPLFPPPLSPSLLFLSSYQ